MHALLGRVTFEEYRGYWPAQKNDTTGITAFLNKVPKYVVSGSLKGPEWENTSVVHEQPHPRGPDVEGAARRRPRRDREHHPGAVPD